MVEKGRSRNLPSWPGPCAAVGGRVPPQPTEDSSSLASAATISQSTPNPLPAMKFDRLVVLLPCHSLEDFDLQRKEDDAEQLLSAWSALWHPLLLAGARAIPRWLPAAVPAARACRLSDHPARLLRAVAAGGLAVAGRGGRGVRACGICDRRDDMLAAALERLGDATGRPVDPDLAADFLALGFCHLQVELLTRKLRYMSNLDEAALQIGGAGGGRRSPRGRCGGRARPPPVGLRPAARGPRVLLSHRGPAARPDAGGRQHVGRRVAGGAGRRAAAKPAGLAAK